MRKRVLSLMVLSMFVIVAILLICIKKAENTEAKNGICEILKPATTTIRAEVMKDVITYNIMMTGTTGSFMDKDYFYTINFLFNKNKDIFVCNYTAGSDVKKGEKLYSLNGKDYFMEYDGRIVDVLQENESVTITVINYDKVYVKFLVDYEDIGVFKAGEKVNLHINYDNGKSSEFEGIIEGIGSVVENNEVNVYVKPNENILPGASVSGEYRHEKNVETMFVLKKMVLSDGIENYVQLIDENGEEEKVLVELGEEFIVKNGEVYTEYVEVFGNLNEGDKLMIEVLTNENE